MDGRAAASFPFPFVAASPVPRGAGRGLAAPPRRSLPPLRVPEPLSGGCEKGLGLGVGCYRRESAGWETDRLGTAAKVLLRGCRGPRAVGTALSAAV